MPMSGMTISALSITSFGGNAIVSFGSPDLIVVAGVGAADFQF